MPGLSHIEIFYLFEVSNAEFSWLKPPRTDPAIFHSFRMKETLPPKEPVHLNRSKLSKNLDVHGAIGGWRMFFEDIESQNNVGYPHQN